MRAYELAHELGIETPALIQAARRMRLGTPGTSSSTVQPQDAARLRHAFPGVVATNTKPIDVVEIEKIQQVINEIVEEYGTDWCGGGRSDVERRLQKIGLTLNTKARVTFQVSITYDNVPCISEDDGPDDPVRDEFKDVLTQILEQHPIVLNGNTVTLAANRYGEKIELDDSCVV